MVKRQIKKGFELYRLYQMLYCNIMFEPRYKNINYRLLKRYVIKKYLDILKTKEIKND